MPRTSFIEKRDPKGEIERTFRDKYLGDRKTYFYLSVLSIGVLTALVIFSYLSSYNGRDYRDGEKHLAPRISAPVHLFGTDESGRDIFLRTMISTKVFFVPGLIAISISLLFGTVLGIASGGLWKGKLAAGMEFLSKCLLDALESFPKYVTLLLVVLVIPRPTFYEIAVALGVLNISRMGKLILGQIRSLKEREFIQASEALGISKLTLILRHILLHNCVGLFIIQASSMMAEVILIEIALNYFGRISGWGLGITVEPPMPSWGSMLEAGSNHFGDGWWWMTVFPLLAVIGSIGIFYVLGDSANKVFGVHKSVEE